MRWSIIIALISMCLLVGCRKASNRKSPQNQEKVEVTTKSPSSENEVSKANIEPDIPQKIIEGWSVDEIQKANTAINCEQLNNAEKDIILYTNLSRLNGKKFCELYVSSLLKEKPNNSYIKSLVKDLELIENLPMLVPNANLIQAAEYHAKDLGKTGEFQHESTDGTSFQKRISSFGYNNPAGENIYAGLDEPLGVVLVLLVDDGVVGVGHRENILRKEFNEIGVSRRPHKKYDYNVVMDLGVR